MDQLDIAVTFDPQRGYIGTARDLRTPVVALSLGGLRRKVETLVLPDEPDIVLRLDRGARLERDRRRRPVAAYFATCQRWPKEKITSSRTSVHRYYRTKGTCLLEYRCIRRAVSNQEY